MGFHLYGKFGGTCKVNYNAQIYYLLWLSTAGKLSNFKPHASSIDIVLYGFLDYGPR